MRTKIRIKRTLEIDSEQLLLLITAIDNEIELIRTEIERGTDYRPKNSIQLLEDIYKQL